MVDILINPTHEELEQIGGWNASDLFGDNIDTELFFIIELPPDMQIWWHNQFNDCCCDQAYFRGAAIPVDPINDDSYRNLKNLMYSTGNDEQVVSIYTHKLFGLDCIRVYGQGIVMLSDGRLLVAEGTD